MKLLWVNKQVGMRSLPQTSHNNPHQRGPGSHRREHLHTLAEVADERHDGHLLHEPLNFTELHHEAVFVRQALNGLALLLKLPHDFDLILCGLEAHQTLHKVHRQSP